MSNQFQPSSFLTLLTIEEDPLLQFPNSASGLVPALTPSATPTVATFSPEQSGYSTTPGANTTAANPSTPTAVSFDNDVDARIIDITEETWGLTTGSTFDHPNVTSDISSPLFSGYLIKRMGARNEDGFLTCGVKLIYAQRPCEALLQEVLVMYRCLATLARIRGIVDPIKSILPWHVAAAKKAHAALRATMRWAKD